MEIVEKLKNAYRKSLDDKQVLELMNRYEMLRDSYMPSAAYTKFVADYMVSERANLEQLGLLKKD